GDKHLCASRRERRVPESPHEKEREIAQKKKVCERNDELFQPGSGFLPRDAANEIGPRGFEERTETSDRVRREADVRVDEDEQRESGVSGEPETGELLAAPAARQPLGSDEPYADDARYEVHDNPTRA